MRDTPADLISVKIGINVVNADLMRLRAFGPAVHGFLDTVREGHPTVPLRSSRPSCAPSRRTPPVPWPRLLRHRRGARLRFVATGDPAERASGKLTLNVIRDELSRIVAQRAADDENLYYLDGRELYGQTDVADLPLPDNVHPDAATHRLIGERFAELAFADRGAFSG
ncbi:Lipase OS=Streptomyces tendae OX=1932 GN=GUR47_05445 PE=4 SV=1 [Streptomyces tendae]